MHTPTLLLSLVLLSLPQALLSLPTAQEGHFFVAQQMPASMYRMPGLPNQSPVDQEELRMARVTAEHQIEAAHRLRDEKRRAVGLPPLSAGSTTPAAPSSPPPLPQCVRSGCAKELCVPREVARDSAGICVSEQWHGCLALDSTECVFSEASRHCGFRGNAPRAQQQLLMCLRRTDAPSSVFASVSYAAQ
ncbi:hypothetical protein RI367_007691 [Sorochytrium milnesiophthora]